MSECNFSYAHYSEIFQTALNEGYQIITLEEWFASKFDAGRKVLINRIDVDDHIQRISIMGSIFKKLGVKASFYFRLHAQGYNLLAFDNVNLVRALAADGHEVGLHSEIVDLQGITGVDSDAALSGSLALFEKMLGIRVAGIASHGDRTPHNNLDFWKDRSPEEFGLAYEAYDKRLWEHSTYVSDSEFVQWKAYENGKLREGDRRCACEHMKAGVQTLYLLTHSCSYYHSYINEESLPVSSWQCV